MLPRGVLPRATPAAAPSAAAPAVGSPPWSRVVVVAAAEAEAP